MIVRITIEIFLVSKNNTFLGNCTLDEELDKNIHVMS